MRPRRLTQLQPASKAAAQGAAVLGWGFVLQTRKGRSVVGVIARNNATPLMRLLSAAARLFGGF